MRAIDAEKKMSELVDKQKIIHEAERLANDFKNCTGGSTCFCIDGNEYHTDTGYAIDGIDAYVEVFTERINALQHEQPEIVYCKYCKHRPKATRADEGIFYGYSVIFPDEICPCFCEDDGWYSWYPSDDFFCARGERKNDEC